MSGAVHGAEPALGAGRGVAAPLDLGEDEHGPGSERDLVVAALRGYVCVVFLGRIVGICERGRRSLVCGSFRNEANRHIVPT